MPESPPVNRPTSTASPRREASPGRYAAFFLVVASGFSVDLLTKWWMFRWLGFPAAGKAPFWLLDHVFAFQTSLNPGALFGMGQGMVLWFALLSMIAAAGVAYWFFFGGASGDWTLSIALGAILAGIFGNLFDRLGLHGLKWPGGVPVFAVRDWILVVLGGWHFPNFNVADSLLVIGAGLLLIHTFRHAENPSTEVSYKNT